MAYLSAEDGQLHPYTDVSREDLYLQHLIIPFSSGMFDKYTVPMAFYVNLKATKKIGKYMSLSFFANRLLDYTPDFTEQWADDSSECKSVFRYGIEFYFISVYLKDYEI